MASILLASKTAACNTGVGQSSIPLKKLHKFAQYEFTNEDIAKAELKILEALGFNTDMQGQPDYVYEKTLLYVEQARKMVSPGPDGEELGDEIRWLLNQCVEILDMTYFNHKLLSSYCGDELACGVI